METNDYSALGKLFSQLDISGTGYLAYRDIPQITSDIFENIDSCSALDFGCGAGRSTNFLKNIGFQDVVGVDQSSAMIELAKKNFAPECIYQTQDNKLPFKDKSFDYILSVFVLFEISSKQEMTAIFDELHRVLKPGGYFTFVTNSEVLYNREWLSLSTEYGLDQKFQNGQKLQILLKDINCCLNDYYWDHKTYLQLIKKSQFKLHSHLSPLGLPCENYDWKDELICSPYSTYTIYKEL